MHIKIDVMTQLVYDEIAPLLQESMNEGYSLIDRLANEYFSGINRFTNRGEALFGVYDEEERLIALGGINRNPYSKEEKVGRLRQFYVMKSYRRQRIGTELVQTIMDYAQNYYSTIVLSTDSREGDLFYRSLGFERTAYYEKSSHVCYVHKKQ
ncbi:GNAT family N-acetyltransferase [Metabacillus iocasae]|uniref:GNAT superfamily N-acetyltransferase n=1 Tax=Priestia iocasae TaxID=2291674 RepID=A0ABS2QW87_9BACI|nr:GNAT family N-acetyltransferase [Metabacillus iocasae]MBM7703724.1 GNAT superfamily N-acetyltransferase [Metabacillus iocasae]